MPGLSSFLLIGEDHKMRTDILTHDKKISIRNGEREYPVGAMMIGCYKTPFCVLVDVVSCRVTTYEQITLDEWNDDGFSNALEGFEGLARYYPDITWQSVATVVRWENARGFFVDHAREYYLNPVSLYNQIGKRTMDLKFGRTD